MNHKHTLRAAEPRDVPAIVGLIGELAEFERLTHLLKVTPELRVSARRASVRRGARPTTPAPDPSPS